jgi:hypothetical protein
MDEWFSPLQTKADVFRIRLYLYYNGIGATLRDWGKGEMPEQPSLEDIKLAKLTFILCPYQHQPRADQVHRIYPATVCVETADISEYYPDLNNVTIFDANTGQRIFHKDTSYREYKLIPSGEARNILGTQAVRRQSKLQEERQECNETFFLLYGKRFLPGAYYYDNRGHVQAYSHYFDALIYHRRRQALRDPISQFVLLAYGVEPNQGTPYVFPNTMDSEESKQKARLVNALIPHEDFFNGPNPQPCLLQLDNPILEWNEGYPTIRGAVVTDATTSEKYELPSNNVLFPSGHVRGTSRANNRKGEGALENFMFSSVVLTGGYVAEEDGGLRVYSHHFDALFLESYRKGYSFLAQVLEAIRDESLDNKTIQINRLIQKLQSHMGSQWATALAEETLKIALVFSQELRVMP